MWNKFKRWLKNLTRSNTPKPDPTPIKPCVIRPTEPAPDNKPFAFTKGQIGVDISHHNKSVDLPLLAKSVDFIYMKATEGTSFVSSVYNSRAAELRKLNIPWGAYHYYKFVNDPIDEAKHFLKYVDVKSGLPPVLDIEAIQNPKASYRHLDDVLAFLEFVEAKTGIRPVLYGGYYFLRDIMQTSRRPKLAKYDLWLPWYRKDFASVKCPAPWSDITIWQYTESGKIAGVNGKVDINKVMS